MTPKQFEIQYKNPKTGKNVKVRKNFYSTEHVSAKEGAEDWAYARADKGWYKIHEIPLTPPETYVIMAPRH